MSKDDWVKQFESMTICLMPEFFSNYHQKEVTYVLYIRVHSHGHSCVPNSVDDRKLPMIIGSDCYWTLIFKARISFKAKKPFVQDKNYLLKYPPSNQKYFKNGCLGYKMIDVTLPRNTTGNQPQTESTQTRSKWTKIATLYFSISFKASSEAVNLNQVNSQSYGLFYRVSIYLSSSF